MRHLAHHSMSSALAVHEAVERALSIIRERYADFGTNGSITDVHA